jgi:hypothetical protein
VGVHEAVDLCCLEIARRLMQTGSAILQAGYGRRCLVILQYSHSQNAALLVHSAVEIVHFMCYMYHTGITKCFSVGVVIVHHHEFQTLGPTACVCIH